jgi:polar amino acid transport system substrate-binding protein
MRTKKLRIAAVNGGEPYYHKDLPTGKWSGFCVDMAKDLATQLEVELEILESTWGNAILDLQSNKIDVMFGVNPTPKRALVIDFSRPFLSNSFTVLAKKNFAPSSWDALNDPKIKIAVDIGSSHDAIARRMAPKATIVGFKTADEASLAVATGRADCQVLVIILSLTALKKNPDLGKLVIPEPVVQAYSTIGVRQEADKRMRDYLSTWADYNRGLGQIREWVIANLALVGVSVDDIPPGVQF